MLSDKDRKQIVESFLKTVEGISDREYQKRVWIRGEGPEVDDFDETCCFFFDDGDPILEKYRDFGITERQYQVLKSFRDKFRKFSDENYHPEEFIESAEWAEIMVMAKDVLSAFHYPGSSTIT
jgi:hypothetical protein